MTLATASHLSPDLLLHNIQRQICSRQLLIYYILTTALQVSFKTHLSTRPSPAGEQVREKYWPFETLAWCLQGTCNYLTSTSIGPSRSSLLHGTKEGYEVRMNTNCNLDIISRGECWFPSSYKLDYHSKGFLLYGSCHWDVPNTTQRILQLIAHHQELDRRTDENGGSR